MLLHASCVAIDHKAVLLIGPSGIGKSDLALRLIDRGARLVADDQVRLDIADNVLIASPPHTIAGMIEIRQLGLVRMDFAAAVPVALYVELAPMDEILERLPEDESVFLLDRAVRRLRLPACAGSTPAKIHAALLYPLVL